MPDASRERFGASNSLLLGHPASTLGCRDSARLLRVALTLLVTGLCVAYLAWKIDLDTTLEVLGDADLRLLPRGGAAIMLVTTVPLAWRWQRLLPRRASTSRSAG